jgi:hypothetical protein
MFARGAVLLDVGLEAARCGLAGLLHSDALLAVSQDAYGDGVAALSRGVPPRAVLEMSRLVEVKFRGPVSHGDPVVALRWEAIGPDGGLFPVLDADITLAGAGETSTSLRLEGVCRPPLRALAAGLDRVISHRVATATIQGFLGRVGEAIASPLPATRTAGANGRRGSSWRPPEAGAS